MKTGLTLIGVAADPRLDALARHTHRRSDVSMFPAGLVALDDQSPTVNGQPGTTVDTRTSGLEWALDKPNPIRRFSFDQPGSPLPTSWPGTSDMD